MAGVVVVGVNRLKNMRDSYLEVTYRRGKPLAAYLYLPRRDDDTVARTVRSEAGLLVDYAADGRAIGLEITAPGQITLAAVNRALAAAQQAPASSADFAPLSLAG